MQNYSKNRFINVDKLKVADYYSHPKEMYCFHYNSVLFFIIIWHIPNTKNLLESYCLYKQNDIIEPAWLYNSLPEYLRQNRQHHPLPAETQNTPVLACFPTSWQLMFLFFSKVHLKHAVVYYYSSYGKVNMTVSLCTRNSTGQSVVAIRGFRLSVWSNV